ncbi:unnamed protein product [Mytilus coruscus]|uniref:C1q domain-containing protein n=1 Tax=Mytilus coruscus TaxID=42192 RepID=A0A6J8C5I4_MYTCO|nr:unnamed protein product [Mytilus coruscus]
MTLANDKIRLLLANGTADVIEVPDEKKRPLFHVELNVTTTLNTNSIVKFDTQFIDEGNNFNTGDGIFVAPVSGVYLFSWNVQTYSSKNVETELRVDNIVKGKQLMALGSGAGRLGTTRNVLCTVNKGDHVWIQTTAVYSDNYFYQTNNGVRSSFIGLFIQEI